MCITANLAVHVAHGIVRAADMLPHEVMGMS